MKLFNLVRDLMILGAILFSLFVFSTLANIFFGCNSTDYSCVVNEFSRSELSATPRPINAAQMQQQFCAKDRKVWDEDSHSCLYHDEVETRRGLKQGFQKIPGTGGFRPGEHFWVSPTEVFGDLHEYVVGEDGGVWDSTGQLVSLSQALDKYPSVPGPDGTPFTAHIFKGSGQDGPFTWMIFNIVPGHVGWIKK